MPTNLMMTHIPEEPVLYIVLGLCLVTLLVLILPFIVKKVEENLELFFQHNIKTEDGAFPWLAFQSDAATHFINKIV